MGNRTQIDKGGRESTGIENRQGEGRRKARFDFCREGEEARFNFCRGGREARLDFCRGGEGAEGYLDVPNNASYTFPFEPYDQTEMESPDDATSPKGKEPSVLSNRIQHSSLLPLREAPSPSSSSTSSSSSPPPFSLSLDHHYSINF
ncbi:hypothetical protein Droror1_Dr00014878 [Drosera rotundifolia]